MEDNQRRAGAVASWRHTAILSGVLLAIAAFGYLAIARAAPASSGAGPSGPALYLPLLAAEWGLFYYVRLGVRNRGNTVRGLIAAQQFTARAIAIDAVLALLLLGLWLAAEYWFDRAFVGGVPAGVQPLLVRRAADIPLWILLAVSAGFVEELVFRGYLQRQFGALLASRWLGVLAQAVLFGVTHGYQGAMPMLKITLFGLLFGAFTLGRRSLVPGMIAHGAVDVIGGLAAFR